MTMAVTHKITDRQRDGLNALAEVMAEYNIGFQANSQVNQDSCDSYFDTLTPGSFSVFVDDKLVIEHCPSLGGGWTCEK